MAEFAYVLMIMFEMQASHLFCIKEDTRQFWADFMQENDTSDEIEKNWMVEKAAIHMEM